MSIVNGITKPFKKHYLPATPSNLPVVEVDEDVTDVQYNVEYHVTEDSTIPLPDPLGGFIGDHIVVVQIRGKATVTHGGNTFNIPGGSGDGVYAPRVIYTIVELDSVQTWVSEVLVGTSETHQVVNVTPQSTDVKRTLTDTMIENATDVFVMMGSGTGTGEMRSQLTEQSIGKRITFTMVGNSPWTLRGSGGGLTLSNPFKCMGIASNQDIVYNDDTLGRWSSISVTVIKDVPGGVALLPTSIIGRWVRPGDVLIKPSYFYQS